MYIGSLQLRRETFLRELAFMPGEDLHSRADNYERIVFDLKGA